MAGSFAELEVFASQLNLRLEYKTVSFGPSHCPMWVCTAKVFDDKSYEDRPECLKYLTGTSKVKGDAEYKVRVLAHQYLGKIEPMGPIIDEPLDSPVQLRTSAVVQPDLRTKSVIQPPTCVPNFEDAFRNIAELLDDCEVRRSASRLAHLRLMLSQLGPTFDNVELPAAVSADNYQRMATLLLDRFAAFDSVLADAHNKLMHSINGNVAFARSVLPVLLWLALYVCNSQARPGLGAGDYHSSVTDLHWAYSSGGSGVGAYYDTIGCQDTAPLLKKGTYVVDMTMQSADGHQLIVFQADSCVARSIYWSQLGAVLIAQFGNSSDDSMGIVGSLLDPASFEPITGNTFSTLAYFERRCLCVAVRTNAAARTYRVNVFPANAYQIHRFEGGLGDHPGVDEMQARLANKKMHSLNGNQFLHGTTSARMVNRHGRKARAKRFVGPKWRALMKRHGIFGPAIGSFVQMTDPFHDEGYDVMQLPSNNTNRSLTCANEATIAISKPTEIADDEKWDLHVIASNIMCPLPYIQLREGQSLDAIPNGRYCTGVEYDFDTDNSSFNNVLAYPGGAVQGSAVYPIGLVAVAVPSGAETVPREKNLFAEGVQVPLPQDLIRGEHRCVGYGFEATNVSSALDKPGMVHVYRVPFQLKQEAVNGLAASPKVVDYVVRQGMMSQRYPGSLASIKAILDTKGWEAKAGAYCVVRPVGMPAVHRPSLAVPITRPSVIEDFQPFDEPTGVYNSTGACGIEITGTPGAKVLRVIPIEFTYHHWDVSGMYFTGLDTASVIQVDVVQCIEHIPNAGNPTDMFNSKIAKIPPKTSPQFEKVFQRTMAVLPPGVPVSENDFGDWWESICDVVSAVSPLADGVVPGSGAIIRTVSSSARHVPKVVKTVKTVVAQHKQRAAAKKSKPVKRVVVKSR